MTVAASAALLEIAVAMSPLGWVLVVGTLAAAAIAAEASMRADQEAHEHAGPVYDQIMAWLRQKT